jgi:mannose-1-phosphate guanylyltransferase
VVQADFEWSDVGSWESVARLRQSKTDSLGNVLAGRCEVVDVANSMVLGDDEHLIGVVGLNDVIVVRTPDATLVCSRHTAEDVKQLVDALEKKHLTRYL